MGLFDKIKKAIDDTGVVDVAKQKAKELMKNQIQENTNEKDNISVALQGNNEPELAEFYKLYAESVKSKKPEVAKEKGIAAISEFINVYTPSLNFLSDDIKKGIWDFTLQQGINCNYIPKNEEDKNALLHFVYSMQKVCDVEDLEEKVLYLWERATKYFDPRLENDLLYTKDVFGKSLKRFKLMIDYFPSNKKISDEAFFKKCSCEHGDCIICKDYAYDEEKLFFTCDKSVLCEKKEDYKSGNLIDDGLMPALRARSVAVNTRKYDDNRKAAEIVLDTYAPMMKNDKIVNMVEKSIDTSGVNRSNLVKYFILLHKKNFEFKPERMLEYIEVLEAVGKAFGADIENADLLANHTLYTKDDLGYIMRMYMTLSNEKWVKEHLLDTSVINFSEFVDESGCVKDGGSDGREGDTIYNIVGKWCYNNENEEVFAEEKRKKEEARAKAERINQMCGSCKNRPGCLAAGTIEYCPRYTPHRAF